VPDADRFPGDCRGFGQQTGSAAHWNRRAWGEESAPGSTHTWRWSGRPRAKIGPHDRDGYGGAPDHVERGHLDAGGLADNGTGQARYRSDHLSYSGSFSRARRPVEALLLAARLDLEKGLRSQRPNGPGALPAARPPAPNPRLTPRWGFSERRGTKNPRIKSRTQIPTTMAMVTATLPLRAGFSRPCTSAYPNESLSSHRRSSHLPCGVDARARAGCRSAVAVVHPTP
jgi:hypothetical protein